MSARSPYNYRQRFRAWRSGGLGALTCPQALKFIRFTNVEFTTSPAIAVKPVLQAGVPVVRVLKPLSILSFATNCPNVFVSDCGLAFLKFLEEKGIFNFFFSAWDRHTLWQALACVPAWPWLANVYDYERWFHFLRIVYPITIALIKNTYFKCFICFFQ